MRHIVQFSTGAGSAEVAYRVVERHGVESVTLLTADTLVEDEDNWRFAREVVAQLGCEWVVLADGRTPMELGYDRRVVPNNRMDLCSLVLKRELLRRWIEAHCDPADTVIHLGFDWTEPHRLERARPRWAPWTVECVLMDEPLLDKGDVLGRMRDRGIEPPRMYALGFSHANCGGACVRGGQAQWELLLRTWPDRYAEWEAGEERIRDLLQRDVSVLRDRTGGTTKPLSLRKFRLRLTAQPALFDQGDWGACGCMGDA